MAIEKLEQVGANRSSRETTRSSAPQGALATARLEAPGSARPAASTNFPSVRSSRELGEQWSGVNDASRDTRMGSIPFFAHFLEGQKPDREGIQTMAYPSDSDADTGKPPGGAIVTMAYPSDSDADTGKPPGGAIVTMAYPSDSDADCGCRHN